MWMRRAGVRPGWIHIPCNNSIGRDIAKPMTVQHDVKRTEAKVVKADLFGGHRELTAGAIVFNTHELILQCLQVTVDITNCCLMLVTRR